MMIVVADVTTIVIKMNATMNLIMTAKMETVAVNMVIAIAIIIDIING